MVLAGIPNAGPRKADHMPLSRGRQGMQGPEQTWGCARPHFRAYGVEPELVTKVGEPGGVTTLK